MDREIPVQVHAVVIEPPIFVMSACLTIGVQAWEDIQCDICRDHLRMFIHILDQLICQRQRVPLIAAVNIRDDHSLMLTISKRVHLQGSAFDGIPNDFGFLLMGE
jgi:hypothetical protein